MITIRIGSLLPTGAIQTGLKALKDGKVRYLGFTGHKDPIIHLKMLSMPFEWASVQMPLNVMDVHYRSFQKQVLPMLLQRNIGALAMKSLGGNGSIVTKAGVPVEEALRYVLSLPISTLVSGIDSEKILDQNLKIVRGFQPISRPRRRPRLTARRWPWLATGDSSCSSRRRCSTGRSIAGSTASMQESLEVLDELQPRPMDSVP